MSIFIVELIYLLRLSADTLYFVGKCDKTFILKGKRTLAKIIKVVIKSHNFMRKWCSNGVVNETNGVVMV